MNQAKYMISLVFLLLIILCNGSLSESYKRYIVKVINTREALKRPSALVLKGDTLTNQEKNDEDNLINGAHGNPNFELDIDYHPDTIYKKARTSAGNEKVQIMTTFLIAYILPLITCIGLIGNVLTVIVFFNSFLSKVPCWFYLASLSISDFGFLSTTILIIISSYSESYQKNGHGKLKAIFNTPGMCQMLSYLHEVFASLSVWIIVIFTVERFLVICRPWKFPANSEIKPISRAKKVITCLIIVCCLWFSYTFKIQQLVTHRTIDNFSYHPLGTVKASIRPFLNTSYKMHPMKYSYKPSFIATQKLELYTLVESNETTANLQHSRVPDNLIINPLVAILKGIPPVSQQHNQTPENESDSEAIITTTTVCDVNPDYEFISYILKNVETTFMLIAPLFIIVFCNIAIVRKLINYRGLWKSINEKNASIKSHQKHSSIIEPKAIVRRGAKTSSRKPLLKRSSYSPNNSTLSNRDCVPASEHRYCICHRMSATFGGMGRSLTSAKLDDKQCVQCRLNMSRSMTQPIFNFKWNSTKPGSDMDATPKNVKKASAVPDARGKNSKSQLAVTKMLLIVSTIFLLFHTPFHASRFALFICSLRNNESENLFHTNPAWITIPYFLRHISYAINVFLYSASGTNFQKAMHQVRLKLKKRLKLVQEVHGGKSLVGASLASAFDHSFTKYNSPTDRINKAKTVSLDDEKIQDRRAQINKHIYLTKNYSQCNVLLGSPIQHDVLEECSEQLLDYLSMPNTESGNKKSKSNSCECQDSSCTKVHKLYPSLPKISILESGAKLYTNLNRHKLNNPNNRLHFANIPSIHVTHNDFKKDDPMKLLHCDLRPVHYLMYDNLHLHSKNQRKFESKAIVVEGNKLMSKHDKEKTKCMLFNNGRTNSLIDHTFNLDLLRHKFKCKILKSHSPLTKTNKQGLHNNSNLRSIRNSKSQNLRKYAVDAILKCETYHRPRMDVYNKSIISSKTNSQITFHSCQSTFQTNSHPSKSNYLRPLAHDDWGNHLFYYSLDNLPVIYVEAVTETNICLDAVPNTKSLGGELNVNHTRERDSKDRFHSYQCHFQISHSDQNRSLSCQNVGPSSMDDEEKSRVSKSQYNIHSDEPQHIEVITCSPMDKKYPSIYARETLFPSRLGGAPRYL